MRTDILIVAGASLASAALGVAIGYFTAKKKFDRALDLEVESLRERYAKKDVKPTVKLFEDQKAQDFVNSMREKYGQQVSDLGYLSEDEVLPEVVDVHGEPLDVDVAEVDFILRGEHFQMMSKGEKKPYIISYEEFVDEHDEFEKESLTYYSGDDTLADSRDDPVDDVDQKINERSLDFFGWRSYDESVVYVRNKSISMDFEIVRDPGRYSHVVMGLEVDPDEPPRGKKRPLKMRDGD